MERKLISISDSARTYLIKQCEKNKETGIKLSVRGGGCAGFSYEYSFCKAPEPNDTVIDLDANHQFVLDSMSLMFVIGTHLDYVSEIGGSSLQLINPNQTSSCGCGKSFSV